MGYGQAVVELRGGLILGLNKVLIFAAAICAGLLTLAVIAYARRNGLVDEPGERRSHSVATPRGGGLSIALVAGALLSFFAIVGDSRLALTAVIGLFLVACVGWLDDHRDLSIRIRLSAHIVASLLLAWASGQGLVGSSLIFASTLVLINVWNFMDGINGIAASQAAVFAACAAILLSGPMAVCLAVVLLGACIGFLPFNFPKARIFMGDVGSGSLGYLIAVLLCLGMQEGGGPLGNVTLWFPLAPFLIDAGWTLIARMVKGEKWWTAHVTHVYQVWARRMGKHLPVTLIYLALALLGAIIASAVQVQDMNFIKISLTLWYTTLSVVWWCLSKQGFARTF